MDNKKYNSETVNSIHDKIIAIASQLKGQDPESIKGHILQVFNDAGITESEWNKIKNISITKVSSTGARMTSKSLSDEVDKLSKSASAGTLGDQNKQNDSNTRSRYFVLFTEGEKSALRNMNKPEAIQQIKAKHEAAALGAGWKQSDLVEPCNKIEVAGMGEIRGATAPYIEVIAEYEFNSQVLGLSPQEAIKQTEQNMSNGLIQDMVNTSAISGNDYQATQNQSLEIGLSKWQIRILCQNF